AAIFREVFGHPGFQTKRAYESRFICTHLHTRSADTPLAAQGDARVRQEAQVGDRARGERSRVWCQDPTAARGTLEVRTASRDRCSHCLATRSLGEVTG